MSFAALRLTLPNQGLQSNRNMLALYRDILVDQVAETEDIGPRLSKIVPHLHNLNRMPLDGATRRSLTEPVIRNFHQFTLKINKIHRANDTDFDSLILECNREISYATKLILRDCHLDSPDELARFIYWAICSLADHLEDYNRQYRPQPGAIWGELHRLYRFACLNDVNERLTNPPQRSDIDSRYKQALLLAASQPEHLNRNDQAILANYLRQWSYRAGLDHQAGREGNGRYFYVDLESNLGIQSARELTVSGNQESVLALNPLPMIEQGRQHMKRIRNGLAVEKLGMPIDLDTIDLFMTLKKAIAAWRQSGTRHHKRTERDTPTRLGIGLRSIHHYLRLPNHSAEDLLSTLTVNQSETGACIRVDNPGTELDVGDIVIHREELDGKGRLGVIRWLKQASGCRFLGIEYLTGDLRPVAVRIQDRITEALLISTENSDSLITHKGYCTSNTAIRLKNFELGLSLRAQAQSVVQRGQTVDQIRLKRQAV